VEAGADARTWIAYLGPLAFSEYFLIRRLLNSDSVAVMGFIAVLAVIVACIAVLRPWVVVIERRAVRRIPGARFAVSGWACEEVVWPPVVRLLVVTDDGLVVWRRFPRFKHHLGTIRFEDMIVLTAEAHRFGPLSRPLPTLCIKTKDGFDMKFVVWNRWLLSASRGRRGELIDAIERVSPARVREGSPIV